MSNLEKAQEIPGAVATSESAAEVDAIERAPDRDLIQWTLSLSIEDRLAVLQDFVDTFWTPQHG